MKKFSSTIAVILLMGLSSLTAYAAADTERPGNVSNLKGVALDGAAKLTWDKTTDNVGVAGYQVHYGTKPVTAQGETYEKVLDVVDVTEYVVTDLENDTTYYFSVIAYDATKNESKKWAKEVSLKPVQEGGVSEDKDAPQVKDAETLNSQEVKVTFSEAIMLPGEDPEDAFTIEVDATLEGFAVLDAKMDEEDTAGKSVILTTAKQQVGTKYKLTVSIDIEDEAGNPIISGTSDTALFTGTSVSKEAEDKSGPKVVKVQATDPTHIIVNFDEAVVLSIDPSENFKIIEEKESEKTLQVLGVELVKNTEGVEDAAVIITTSEQEDKSYVVIASKLKDETGNTVDSEKNSAIFTGQKAPSADGDNEDDEDKVAPKDVAKFLAKTLFEGEKYLVTLTWEIPKANIGDVIEQIVYMSTDKGENYEKKATLDPEATKYEAANLDAGEYWFKLTQKDAAGNESEGVIKKVILSKTGPEMLGLILVSLGLGRIFGKKKRK
ncbi:fibronectin type III domain-containing protein [Candidatus Peregrinibacteria bacterium]|nr:fibronectin type III domain-containing protein [Candidatus Peregrinibacteria bacterium]